MKKIISSLILTILLFSCAEIVPPSGGEKDITPPKVQKSNPKNYSINFSLKKIELKFDEFVKINTGGGNIIISPSLTKKPKFDLIGKKLIVSFEELLQPETTYIINFGESIKDNNEGNILKNYKYVFSTGNFIDSLKIEGKVINAFTKEPIEGALVGLYPKDEDSILYKKPLYFTKTSKSGNYSLENLKVNSYRIAALEDKNLNYIFDQETEKIAFQDSIINLQKNKQNKPLILFSNIKDTRVKKYNNEVENHLIFNFNKPFVKTETNIDFYNNDEIIYNSLDKKALHYWYFNRDSSTTNISIKTDDLLIDSFSIKLKNNQKIDPFDFSIKTQETENNNIIDITFPFPIKDFNQSKFNLSSDNKKVDYKINWYNNDLNLKITTNTLYDTLKINIENHCFSSFHNQKSIQKIDTLHKFEKDFSSLIININKEKNLGIELYNKDEELINKQNVSRETKITFNNLIQGKYILRIYQDNNKDGIWNTGMFHVKQQPEKTLIYKTIELKDNWDKELDIKID